MALGMRRGLPGWEGGEFIYMSREKTVMYLGVYSCAAQYGNHTTHSYLICALNLIHTKLDSSSVASIALTHSYLNIYLI